MKAINYNTKTTAKIIIGYLALIFTLAILFTSCQSSRSMWRNGCGASKMYSGYGPGGYKFSTHVNSRQSF